MVDDGRVRNCAGSNAVLSTSMIAICGLRLRPESNAAVLLPHGAARRVQRHHLFGIWGSLQVRVYLDTISNYRNCNAHLSRGAAQETYHLIDGQFLDDLF